MGRRCVLCKTGHTEYQLTEHVFTYMFPADLDECQRWFASIPNCKYKSRTEISKYAGICGLHWPVEERVVAKKGRNYCPATPPSIFDIPATAHIRGTPAEYIANYRRPRNICWMYFEKRETDIQRAFCRLCTWQSRRNYDHVELFGHLKKVHTDKFQEAEASREEEIVLLNEINSKTNLNFKVPPSLKDLVYERPKSEKSESKPYGLANNISLNSTLSPAELQEQRAEDRERKLQAFHQMIALDMEHPSILKRPGFGRFVRTLDPTFEPPKKKKLTDSNLPHMMKQIKDKVTMALNQATSVALSVETWKHRSTETFMTVYAQFINDAWKMCNVVLETFSCSGERTATDVATHLQRITDEWGITERVVALVSDSEDEVVLNASALNGWELLKCFGYTIDQIVHTSLASVPEIARIDEKCREAVRYFELIPQVNDTLTAVQKEHSMDVLGVKQNRTSQYWLSTLSSWERFVEQYKAINTALCLHSQNELCIRDDEVETVRDVIQVFDAFEIVANEMCSDIFTPLSKIIPVATLLQQVIEDTDMSEPPQSPSSSSNPQPNPTTEIEAALKSSLASQMQCHMSKVEEHFTLAAATLLDPRFKQHAFINQESLATAQNQLLREAQAVLQSSLQGPGKGRAAPSGGKAAQFWEVFDQKVVGAGATKTSTSDAENETSRFFKESNIPRTSDPLKWWKLNAAHYPNLKILAKKFLCVMATSIDSRRIFTKHGDDFSKRRDSFRPKHLPNMIFIHRNIRL